MFADIKVFSPGLPLTSIPEFRRPPSRVGAQAALPCQPALADLIDNADSIDTSATSGAAMRSTAAPQQLKRVQIAALSPYYGDGAAQPGLLLGFCCFDESEIRSNIDVLTAIIEAQASARNIARPPVQEP